MKNWGKTQGDRQQKPGKWGYDPEGEKQMLQIPYKVPQEGFDLEIPPVDTAKESNRDDQPAQSLMETMHSELIERTQAEVTGEIFCLSALYPRENNLKDHPLQVFKETSDPDNMYLHEVMKDPERKEFITAMVKEVTDHMENVNYTITPKSQVPTGATILP